MTKPSEYECEACVGTGREEDFGPNWRTNGGFTDCSVCGGTKVQPTREPSEAAKRAWADACDVAMGSACGDPDCDDCKAAALVIDRAMVAGEPVADSGMSECLNCGERYPCTPAGTIHKCGKCSGGFCLPVGSNADALLAALVDPAPDTAALVSALERFRDHVVRHACTWDEAASGSHHHPIWAEVADLIAQHKGTE